jgi:hypothetical protein
MIVWGAGDAGLLLISSRDPGLIFFEQNAFAAFHEICEAISPGGFPARHGSLEPLGSSSISDS